MTRHHDKIKQTLPKSQVVLNPKLFECQDGLYFVAYGSSNLCMHDKDNPQQNFEFYEKDQSEMTATVKFQSGYSNEILLHFDDLYRMKLDDGGRFRMENLDYVIENGILIIKHTKSRFLMLQEISKLKSLARASDE